MPPAISAACMMGAGTGTCAKKTTMATRLITSGTLTMSLSMPRTSMVRRRERAPSAESPPAPTSAPVPRIALRSAPGTQHRNANAVEKDVGQGNEDAARNTLAPPKMESSTAKPMKPVLVSTPIQRYRPRSPRGMRKARLGERGARKHHEEERDAKHHRPRDGIGHRSRSRSRPPRPGSVHGQGDVEDEPRELGADIGGDESAPRRHVTEYGHDDEREHAPQGAGDVRHVPPAFYNVIPCTLQGRAPYRAALST